MLAACIPCSQPRVGGLLTRKQCATRATTTFAPVRALAAKRSPRQSLRDHCARAKTGVVGRKRIVTVSTYEPRASTNHPAANGQATIKVRYKHRLSLHRWNILPLRKPAEHFESYSLFPEVHKSEAFECCVRSLRCVDQYIFRRSSAFWVHGKPNPKVK